MGGSGRAGRAGDMSNSGILGSGTGYGISLWFGVADGLSHRRFFRLPPSFHIFLSCPGVGLTSSGSGWGHREWNFPMYWTDWSNFDSAFCSEPPCTTFFVFFIFKGGWKFNPWPIGHNPVYPPMVYPGRFFFPPHLFLRRRRARQAIEMIEMGRLFLDPVFWTF